MPYNSGSTCKMISEFEASAPRLVIFDGWPSALQRINFDFAGGRAE